MAVGETVTRRRDGSWAARRAAECGDEGCTWTWTDSCANAGGTAARENSKAVVSGPRTRNQRKAAAAAPAARRPNVASCAGAGRSPEYAAAAAGKAAAVKGSAIAMSGAAAIGVAAEPSARALRAHSSRSNPRPSSGTMTWKESGSKRRPQTWQSCIPLLITADPGVTRPGPRRPDSFLPSLRDKAPGLRRG